jgi:hypothetical protein
MCICSLFLTSSLDPASQPTTGVRLLSGFGFFVVGGGAAAAAAAEKKKRETQGRDDSLHITARQEAKRILCHVASDNNSLLKQGGCQISVDSFWTLNIALMFFLRSRTIMYSPSPARREKYRIFKLTSLAWMAMLLCGVIGGTRMRFMANAEFVRRKEGKEEETNMRFGFRSSTATGFLLFLRGFLCTDCRCSAKSKQFLYFCSKTMLHGWYVRR